jgi:2-oxoglutarate dehydrogenase E1 component
MATSALDELTNGAFRAIIPEQLEHDPDEVRKLILCTGKVYYDLHTARLEKQLVDTAIIRIEQLYPFPRSLLVSVLAEYPALKSVVWCQEEPMNQGAWYQIRHHLEACTGEHHSLEYIGREASAAPATGSYSLHMAQLHEFIEQALKPATPANQENQYRKEA